jgi:hypothetical protein
VTPVLIDPAPDKRAYRKIRAELGLPSRWKKPTGGRRYRQWAQRVAQSHARSFVSVLKYVLSHEGHRDSPIRIATKTVDKIHNPKNQNNGWNSSPNQNPTPSNGIRAHWICKVLISNRSLRNSSGWIMGMNNEGILQYVANSCLTRLSYM